MATAFIGYVLPWGQMSFWGATVITNLFSAIPVIGESLVIWIWGGFCVDNATLNRFFSLHYLLPFVVVALVLAHIVMLHQKGSSNPIGIYTKIDKVSFYRFFIPKDIFGWIILFFIYSFFILKSTFASVFILSSGIIFLFLFYYLYEKDSPSRLSS